MSTFDETAYHEAGHAACLCYYNLPILHLEMNEPVDRDGKTLTTWGTLRRNPQVQAESNKQLVVVAMAGPIAESKYVLHKTFRENGNENASMIPLETTQVESLFEAFSRIKQFASNGKPVSLGGQRLIKWSLPRLGITNEDSNIKIFPGNWNGDVEIACHYELCNLEVFQEASDIVEEMWSEIDRMARSIIERNESIRSVSGGEFAVHYLNGFQG